MARQARRALLALGKVKSLDFPNNALRVALFGLPAKLKPLKRRIFFVQREPLLKRVTVEAVALKGGDLVLSVSGWASAALATTEGALILSPLFFREKWERFFSPTLEAAQVYLSEGGADAQLVGKVTNVQRYGRERRISTVDERNGEERSFPINGRSARSRYFRRRGLLYVKLR